MSKQSDSRVISLKGLRLPRTDEIRSLLPRWSLRPARATCRIEGIGREGTT